jgi:hypothetical protein
MLVSPNAAPASERATRIEVTRILDDAHALAAAAGDGLDDDGIADLVRDAGDVLVGHPDVEGLLGPRHDRDARADRRAAGGGLAAHERDRFGRGADERQAGVAARARERRVLGQESVARVDGVRAGPARGVEDGVNPEVAADRLARADVQRLVGLADVAGVAIAIGIDGDGGQSHLAAGANDPDGDLAAVGDQNFHETWLQGRKKAGSPVVRLGYSRSSF